MEELSNNLEQIRIRAKNFESKLELEVSEFEKKLEAILFGIPAALVNVVSTSATASPQQKKKRVKRLSSVADDDNEEEAQESPIDNDVANNTVADDKRSHPEQQVKEEHVFLRPMRAAKLKADCLKEPSINTKLRRPDGHNETNRKIKKENEQRASQANIKKSSKANKSGSEAGDQQTFVAANESVASSKKTDESLLVVPEKDAPVVEIFSEEESTSSISSAVTRKKPKKESSSKNIVVKLEKLSLPKTEVTITPESTEASAVKHEVTSSIEDTLQTTTSTAKGRPKRGRQKKPFIHRPIKEEHVSPELPNTSPISTRSRSGSINKQRPASVYEDAVDNMPSAEAENEKVATTPQSEAPAANNVCNETVATKNLTMVTACDATFLTNEANGTFAVPPTQAQTTFVMANNPNATVTISNDGSKKPNGSLGDATFDVRDPQTNDSLMTEDDSFEMPLAQLKQMPKPPPPASAKVLKTKSKPKELFNPCVQSPVKKKVEAFEHHAQTASQELRLKTRSKKTKENSEPELPSIRDLKANSVTTPTIGKLHAPALGRFLTPTQQSNVTPTAGNAKKLPNSASKIMQFPISKQASASNLKSTHSSSSQSLSRENTDEDLKKGFNKLQQLAEERKKKREQKHQQAALQREAKEKERAERLKKIMKEREDKNRKRALEIEQKKRELEEINRNLKMQEERELKMTAATKTKMDAADIARQERELLEQMKTSKTKMPPPAKQGNKYNFDMLHSDDSTDEEGKTSYKRPTPPLWSKSSARAECITNQSHLSSDIIDSFFSVQPMTPDLKAIFPNIDPRYLKRNSSAIWQTPPRYSEMPKY